jgi:hypothetical protein
MTSRKEWVMRRYVGILAALLMLQGTSGADLKLKGLAFGDYYWAVSGSAKEQNGFQIRRIYLTFDKTWNERFSGRFRMEANDAGFGAGNKMTTAVKDASLKYKKSGRSLVVGLSPSPTWSITEEIWGYRSVEKTIMDLNGLGSSRDLGVLFETPFDAKGKVKAQFMFGNGNSNKSETNNDKKGYARLAIAPSKSVSLLLYADYETRPGDQDRTTFSTVAYSSNEERALAVEGVWQQRKSGGTRSNVAVRGVSLFGRSKTKDDFGFFGRVDYFDPSDQSTDDAVTRIIGGVDFIPESDIHIIPNVIVEQFQDSSIETVVTPRVTVYCKF